MSENEPETRTGAFRTTVYFDGTCPLCRREIGYYRSLDTANTLAFIDVSRPAAAMPPDLSRHNAMARFHVRDGLGELRSGASAFVHVWSLLPRWRWAARVAGLPGVRALMECGYRLSLPLRPRLAKLVSRLSDDRSRSSAAAIESVRFPKTAARSSSAPTAASHEH